MNKIILALVLSFAAFGCLADGEAFSEASIAAQRIIEAQAESPICHQFMAPAAMRNTLVSALSGISSPGLSDATGLSPMDYAVIADDVSSIKRLIAIGYPLTTKDGTLLHRAALNGSRQALVFLLANGVSSKTTNEYGATPLMVAAAEGRLDIAQVLIEAGSSVNARNKDSGTALHYAIGCRNAAMIDALLSAGAEVDSIARLLARKNNVTLKQHER